MGFSPGTGQLSSNRNRKLRRAPFERRVIRFCLALATPGVAITAILIWFEPWSLQSKLILLGVEALACLLIGAALLDHIIHPLQTLANVVGALRDEDYSFRARLAIPNDALGELSLEVNALADLLAQHRTGAIEATALLERVVEEVELPIFAFDPQNRLRLLNSAGQKLLQKTSAQLVGKTAEELHLEGALACENEALVELHIASNARWFVRRSTFRQRGVPHTLMVLSDVSRALREEERRAWQRLIRVMGHELNNSLAPIKSIAGSLHARLANSDIEQEERQDFERGLSVIETRAESLNRFLQAYRQLAQMPPPAIRECSVGEIVRRTAALENRVEVSIVPGPDIMLAADPDQLEQMIINLVRNAAEAVVERRASSEGGNGSRMLTPESMAPITLAWEATNKDVIVTVTDRGPGLMNPTNAFVPFYTTKPQGSGIGLILSRQICEAHGGSIELVNRNGETGCIAKVTLPRSGARTMAQ